jgi:hypothetical protein
VNASPVIDAIEGGGWRQEIRRELLCKLQQKLSAHRPYTGSNSSLKRFNKWFSTSVKS